MKGNGHMLNNRSNVQKTTSKNQINMIFQYFEEENDNMEKRDGHYCRNAWISLLKCLCHPGL